MKSIIFNQHQVNHALRNKEGMFRVVVKPQPRKEVEWSDCGILQDKIVRVDLDKSPYQVGETIFVKESFWINKKHGKFCWYDSDIFECGDRVVKKPAQHMKQEHSRLTLRIKSVKVERLQDISEKDCWKEGCEEFADYQDVRKVCEMAKQIGDCIEDARPAFAVYWNSTHKKPEEKFEASPLVWCFEYEVVR